MDLRCPHKLFGRVTVPGDAEVEFACSSRWCGKRSGVTVLHTFSTRTGELIRTRRFQSPKGREDK